MNVRSLLRSLRKKWFGAAAPRHKPFRHKPDLGLERLEERDLFSVTPPTILKVTPPDFTNVGPVNPVITVQFSEAMSLTDVTTASNYLLFNAGGQQITPLDASNYDPVTNTETIAIPNQLPAGAYTLFLRGDLIHEATGTFALSQPGQLVVANMGESQAPIPQPGPSTVSTINVANDGTLNTVTSYALGQSLKIATPFPPPLLITSADFNGDGINDVAVITHNTDTTPVTNTLDIFDGRGGTQGFAPTPTIELSLPATSNPVSLLAFSERKTDQTASGVFGPDLAVTDKANGQVIVFKNTTQLNGPTSFGAGKPFSTLDPNLTGPSTPVGLVAADFNGDNNMDLAVADDTLYTVNKVNFYVVDVLPGLGNGTFGAAQGISLGAGPLLIPSDLAAGPLDTGPLPDIAVSGLKGVEVLFDISPKTGPFVFSGPLVVNLTTDYFSIAVGQIDQPAASAFDDIVATGLIKNPTGPGSLAQVTVFTNVGPGSFAASPPITLPQIRDPNDLVPLVLADLTPAGLASPPNSATGPLDILLPYTDTNAVFNEFLVLHNTSTPGSPSFTTTAYQVDNAPVALTVGNGGATNQGAITVVENGQIVNGRNGVGTNGGDINGDGIPDVLTVNIGRVVRNLTGRSITVARGVGDGTFLDATTVVEAPGGTPASPIDPAPAAIAVGDLNGDGIPDYVVADSATNQVEVYLGVAPASAGSNVTYADPVTYPVSLIDPVTHLLGGLDPVSVTLADLTGTGKLDIVTADNADNFISILPNNGNGTFGTPTLVSVGQGPTQVIAGIFDKFGGGATPTKTAEDLIVAHNGTSSSLTSRGVSVLINDNTGNGTFVNNNVPTEYGSGNDATAVAAGDFNADGNLDFVFTNSPLSGPGSVLFMQGDGHGNFSQVGAPITVAADPVALAVADVNRDGLEDVIVGSQSPNLTTAIGVLLNTVGDGFRPPIYTSLPNETPVNSLAVTDLPTTVTTTLATNITATQTLIPVTSAHGFPPTAGFTINVEGEIMTVTAISGTTFTVIRGGGTGAVAHQANAVVTAANVTDPYPDLVVGTFPVSLTSPLPVVDNVFTLQGVGDGTFFNPLPYEAGGPPSPTTVAVAADPLIRLNTFFMGGTLISTNLVKNGTFDARDLSNEEGNIVGWHTASIQDSHGSWNTQNVTSAGSFSPLSTTGVPRPDGLFQAMLDESNLTPLPVSSALANPNPAASYQGSNFLYQDVTIPANVTAASFSIRLTIDNLFTTYATGDAGASLDYRSLSADQQVRVDLMDPTASIFGTNVYRTIFQSDQGTPLNTKTPLTITDSDITALAGKTVRIRISVVNNRGLLVVGVDDVDLQVTYTDAGSALNNPTLPVLRLRNPGYLSGPSNLPTTTDATLIGTVADDGGISNIAFIAFEPVPGTSAGPFNPNDPNVFRTNYFDAQGNFSVLVPNLKPGTYTFNVRVQDVAGNHADSQITFIYQGLSNTAWGATGPSQIDTTAQTNISYTSVSGEVTATASDPTDPSGNTILLGSANGGVWRTTDGGSNWTPLTDNLTFNGQPINTPIGAIAFAPSHSNLVYAATGTGNALPTSQVSVGILVSSNGGQSGSWSIVGTSASIFANARITAMALAPSSTPATTADPIYVAVASGGAFGPGVYRSLNGGLTWTNVMTLANLAIPLGDAAPATLASVTSLVINPRATSEVTVGLGNIGLAANSTSAGVWTTSNADTTIGTGPTWNPVLGGDNTLLLNDTLPTDLGNTPATVKIGRVTVAQGFASPSTGPGSDIATLYVMIGNPSQRPPLTPQAVGGDVDYGNGANPDPVTGSTIAGLYKSPNGGLDWTHVMLKVNTARAGAPIFQNINLLGNDANNVGQLVVDPTDVNVVYVGGADNAALSFGLIRVDTGDMRGVSSFLNGGAPTNDGDDLFKAATAAANGGNYPVTGGAYTGEGVSWYDLESDRFSPDFNRISNSNQEPKPGLPIPRGTGFQAFSAGALSRLPAEVDALGLDRSGRLLIGTQEGAWRAVYHGTGYDYSSGGTGIVAQANLTAAPPTASVAITTINGNLQISNLTSVASDPLNRGQYYAAGYDTGTMTTSNGLSWQTMGLNGPATGLAAATSVDAGVVLVASPDPTAPVGTPTTVFRDFAFSQLGKGYFPETNTQNGALGFWNATQPAGISIKDSAGYFPVLVIDPNKVFNSGVFQDLLLFGTDRIYKTTTSSNNWKVVGPNQPLSALGGIITAAAIAPSNTSVLYAGDNLGEVFVTLNSGTWTQVGGGVLPPAPVTGISVDPRNPLIAYVTFGGNGPFGHVWRTINGGASWTNIATATSGLPPGIPAYSVVTDPRPSAGAPNGHLYLGTQVGVFVSSDLGATWTRFGAGSIPNVPVVNLQFNPTLQQLTAATEGRGAFVLSVDFVGAHVVSVTPNTPVRPGFSSVTVTFSEAITSFPLNQVSITSPTGAVITPTKVFNASITPPGQSNPATTWEIDFPAQNSPIDGSYTFKIGPRVLDLVGNPMDQNQNNVNGEVPGDIFTFVVATSSTDDGQFVSGVYNDLLGRPVNTTAFLAAMNLLEPARFAQLPGIASSYVMSARTQLINDLYSSINSTASTLGIANLFGVAPTGPQLSAALSALQRGASFEQLLSSLVASDQLFDLAGVNESDSAFVTRAYTDLLGTAPTTGQLNAGVAQLSKAEVSARLKVALQFVASNLYIDTFVTNGYFTYLGIPPTAAQVSAWETAFHNGSATQQSFIASLMGTNAYFQNAPNIVTPVGQIAPPPSPTVFIQAVYQQLFNGSPGTDTASPGEVNFWLAKFAQGMTHQQMVTQLLATDRYRQAFITLTYLNYLGRVPLSSELTAWDSVLAGGYPAQNMVANIFATQEFFLDQAAGATRLHDQDTNWVNQIYLLAGGGAPPNNSFNVALDNAEISARSVLALGLTAGSTYRTRLVNFVYNTYFGRAPKASELAAWQTYLAGPSNGPGALSRDEVLLANVLGSKEYFFDQTDISGLHTNASWANSLDPSLRLAPNPAQAAATVTQILKGYVSQRLAVDTSVTNSTEYRTDEIKQDFQKFLLRAPTQAEINTWLLAFANGFTREFEIASLIGTNEFFTKAPNILGVLSPPTFTLFVKAAYHLLVPYFNVPASVFNFWVPRLQNHTATQTQFAQTITAGSLYLFNVFDSTNGLVNALYNRFTGANATPAEIMAWQRAYTGIGYDIDGKVITNLLATPGYFLKPHPFP